MADRIEKGDAVPVPDGGTVAAPYVNSRDTILEVALELFSNHGFEGVAMRAISQAANVTSPTVYHFFGDKRGLYRAVLLEAYRRIAVSLPEDPADLADPRDKLRAWILDQLERYDDQAAVYRLFLRDMLDPDDSIRHDAVSLTLSPVYDYLSGLVAKINPKLEPDVAAVIVLSFMAGANQMERFTVHLPPKSTNRRIDKAGRGVTVDMFMRMIAGD